MDKQTPIFVHGPIFVHSEEELKAAMIRQNITRKQAWDMLTQSKSFEYRVKNKRDEKIAKIMHMTVEDLREGDDA